MYNCFVHDMAGKTTQFKFREIDRFYEILAVQAFVIDSKELDHMNNTKLIRDDCQHKTIYTPVFLKGKQL